MCPRNSRRRASTRASQAARSSGVWKIFLFRFTVFVSFDVSEDLTSVDGEIGQCADDRQHLDPIDPTVVVHASRVPASGPRIKASLRAMSLRGASVSTLPASRPTGDPHDMSVRPNTPDKDPLETQEWLDSVDAVVHFDGRERAGFLLDHAIDRAQEHGVRVSAGLSTPYVNTIPVEEEAELPGDHELGRAATALVRWNAIAIVLQANAKSTELGGHIASYQSAETLYEVGFNHFWRARAEEHLGDLVSFQGHSSPRIYARAYLQGRPSQEQLHRFRQEVDGGGLSSYP